MTHMGFTVNKTLKRLAAKITPKNAHLITLSDEKSGTTLFKALKTGFVENRGQSGPLSVDGKTYGKCQQSVEFSAICQLLVNPIQTLPYFSVLGLSR